jgi:hypothetical protein
MIPESIIKGSSIISEFLEHKKEVFPDTTYYHIDGVGYSPENMRYHYSWDWLMPVCQKFSTIITKIPHEDREEYLYKCQKLNEQVVKYNINIVFVTLCEYLERINQMIDK